MKTINKIQMTIVIINIKEMEHFKAFTSKDKNYYKITEEKEAPLKKVIAHLI